MHIQIMPNISIPLGLRQDYRWYPSVKCDVFINQVNTDIFYLRSLTLLGWRLFNFLIFRIQNEIHPRPYVSLISTCIASSAFSQTALAATPQLLQ
jgi:hypothetical protein